METCPLAEISHEHAMWACTLSLCQVKVCPEGEPKSEVPEKVMNKKQQKLLFVSAERRRQGANHWYKLAWDTGQVHT